MNIETLTAREREVIDLTLNGLNLREIGEKLFISPKTAMTHRRRALDKLGLDATCQLASWYMAKLVSDWNSLDDLSVILPAYCLTAPALEHLEGE